MPLHTDEIFHILAATSWAEDGSFRFGDGSYSRAWVYTILAGASFEAFGQTNVFLARLPAVIAGALMVPVLFVWMIRSADRTAAWLSALLLCFAELAIRSSDFARFYSLQALLVLVAAAMAYRFLLEPSRRKVWLPLLALACLALAAQLQVTTMIAAGAMGLFLVLYLATRQRTRAMLADAKTRNLILVLVAIAAAGAAVVGYLALPMLLEAEPWAEKNKSNYLYYHIFLSRDYRLFWYLIPVASILALSRYPRLAAYCLVMWLVPLVVHSFGGMKADRYISYAFPFFIALWGLAFAAAVPWLRPAIVQIVEKLACFTGLRVGERWQGMITALVLVLCAISATAVNKMLVESPKLIAKGAIRFARDPASTFANPPDPNWSDRLGVLRRDMNEGAVLVSVDELRTQFYLGTPNFGMYLPPASVTTARNGFTIDVRNGRPVLEDVDDLARVVSCTSRGVLVIPARRWLQFGFMDEPMAEFIKARLRPGPPRIPEFHVFRWQHPAKVQGCQAVQSEARTGTAHAER
ncbi:ArnT family glycosyltransferase [Novosphingobium endophyticum]|nr:hypothetical protein [Novosphingobium endophyticum]